MASASERRGFYMSADRFFSNFTSRLDTKGRVSIPAAFRAVLARDGYEGLYCFPCLDRAAIDAGGHGLLAEIDLLLGRFPPRSERREELLVALFGRSETLRIDGEGRVVLTDMLKSHAGITVWATFVGLGHRFQIWEPERFRAHLEKATATMRALTRELGLERAPPGGGARE